MRELDASVEERNYTKSAPLTKKEIESILKVAPSVASVVNTRNKGVKELGWKEKAPSKTAFIKGVLEDNNRIRRPILIVGKEIVIGKNDDVYRELLG